MTLTLLRRRKSSLQQHSASLHDTPLWKNRHTIPLNTIPPTLPSPQQLLFPRYCVFVLAMFYSALISHLTPKAIQARFFPLLFFRCCGNGGMRAVDGADVEGKRGRFASPLDPPPSFPPPTTRPWPWAKTTIPPPLFFSLFPPGPVLPVHFCGGQVKAENSYSL